MLNKVTAAENQGSPTEKCPNIDFLNLKVFSPIKASQRKKPSFGIWTIYRNRPPRLVCV